jgi:hypothetical protein
MIDPATHQQIVDEEHLRLLRIAWFISAAANIFWLFFPLIYVVMGLFMALAPLGRHNAGDGPPRELGWIVAAIGSAIFAVMAIVTTLKVLTARALGRRRARTLILVASALSCLGIPWGTVLGVFTLLVMARPSVAAQFTGAHGAS